MIALLKNGRKKLLAEVEEKDGDYSLAISVITGDKGKPVAYINRLRLEIHDKYWSSKKDLWLGKKRPDARIDSYDIWIISKEQAREIVCSMLRLPENRIKDMFKNTELFK